MTENYYDNLPPISEFIEKYKLTHWKFVINEKNKGWKENFKYGLLEAKGDIVFPCDQKCKKYI